MCIERKFREFNIPYAYIYQLLTTYLLFQVHSIISFPHFPTKGATDYSCRLENHSGTKYKTYLLYCC